VIEQASAMADDDDLRRVVILAPMPLEMEAITTAFGLAPAVESDNGVWTGRVGDSLVTAIHIGMGPPLTRVATKRLFDERGPESRPVDHVMIAGICGGLDPDLDVGTLINPEVVVSHTTGVRYTHRPPGSDPQRGKLVTTEGVSLDHDLSRTFFAEGFLGVDMESSAVAEVCEAHGCAWSVYRCIGDRYFDGYLDERVISLMNADGSGNTDELMRLISEDPQFAKNLEQLSHDSALAARLAAEAAYRGCLALDASV
jgi:adenosylhomocysteine nucleosidase